MKTPKTKSSKSKSKKTSKTKTSKSSKRLSCTSKLLKLPLPKLETSFVNTKITKGSDGQYHIEGFILDQSIIKVKNQKPITNYEDALFIADVTKNAILTAYNQGNKKFSKTASVRINPFRRFRNPGIDNKDDDDAFGLHSFETGVYQGVAMPSNPFDAHELGRMTGMRDALENYCPIPWYNFKDRKIKKQMLDRMDNIIKNGFYEMAKRVVMQREGYSRFVPQMPRQQGGDGGGTTRKQKNQQQQRGGRAPLPVS